MIERAETLLGCFIAARELAHFPQRATRLRLVARRGTFSVRFLGYTATAPTAVQAMARLQDALVAARIGLP